MYSLNDTITAVASAPGGAVRGIVRLSGPNAHACAAACFQTDHGSSLPAVTAPRAISGTAQIEGLCAGLPCEVYLWPERRSYTGQAAAEFHTIGSPPLLDALLHALCTHGARPAQPGEFTLRAFFSGRIDLTQAEAVLGVVNAAGDRELDAALNQLAGGFAEPLRRLRRQLLELLAHLEAGFDFADEDLAFITPGQLHDQIAAASRQVSDLLTRLSKRTFAEPTVRVVFVGQPNTGKSSLFNALIRRTGAIVSPQSGTTRDYLTAEIDLDGLKCVLVDTAGFAPEEAVENLRLTAAHAAAQAVARQQHARAALSLLCLEAGRPLDVWEQNALAQATEASVMVVVTKIDDTDRQKLSVDPQIVAFQQHGSSRVVFTSSVTEEGLDVLRRELCRILREQTARGGDVVPGTAVRCQQSLVGAAEALRRTEELVRRSGGEEFVAAEIRLALDELGKVVGAVYTDDILEQIFSRFCVGK